MAYEMPQQNYFPQTASFVAAPQALPTAASMIAYPGASAMDGPFKFYAQGQQPQPMYGAPQQAAPQQQGAPRPGEPAPQPDRRPAGKRGKDKKKKTGCC